MIDSSLSQLSDAAGSDDSRDGKAPEWIEVDFFLKPRTEQLADLVVELWKSGMKLKEIGPQVGLSRSATDRAFRHWHESRGLPTPHGFSNRNRRPPSAKILARREHVMKRIDEG